MTTATCIGHPAELHMGGGHRGAPAHSGQGSLPPRAGIGLKPQHFQDIAATRPEVGFFEIHAENYMVAGGPMHHWLQRIRERYALSIHGVGLSIGSEGALDVEHLDRLAALLARYEPQSFAEHLAWSTHGGAFFNDLLPLPYDRATLVRVCDHIDQVQTRLGRRMLLENPATYVEFARSTMAEADFITEVVRHTGCGLLLDVNNAYVSAINHGRDVDGYVDALPLHAVGEIHLAGFAVDRDAIGAQLLIDSHGSPVDEAVWRLYEFALLRVSAVATLIERDNDIPGLGELVSEAARADALLREVWVADVEVCA